MANGDVSQTSLDAIADLESSTVRETGHLLGLGHFLVEDDLDAITVAQAELELANNDDVKKRGNRKSDLFSVHVAFLVVSQAVGGVMSVSFLCRFWCLHLPMEEDEGGLEEAGVRAGYGTAARVHMRCARL